MSDLNGHEQDRLTLTAADAAAVDALLDAAEAGAADAARKERAAAWLKVLDGADVPAPAGDLAERTLRATLEIDRMRMPAPGGTADEPPAHRPRWRRRLAEFAAMGVAACLFVAVLLAGLSQAQKSQVRMACVGNMKNIGSAMGVYSTNAGAGALPMVRVASNGNWLHGSSDGAHTNAAHLLALLSGNYMDVKWLFCPGAPGAGPAAAVIDGRQSWDIGAIGYSYRNMYAADKPKWDGVRTIIMTDRNPVFADPGRKNVADANSDNHDGRGTNVLRADGSVTWATSPNIGPNHDNIWTINSGGDRLLFYNGTELPASLSDVIVCP